MEPGATVALQLNEMVPVNEGSGFTVTVALTLEPCATWKLAASACRVNGAVVVNAIDAAWWLTVLKVPVLAVITTVPVALVLPAWIVATVCVAAGGVTVVGLNEQLAPVGNPEQAKLTEPAKLLIGVTVMVAVPL